MGMQGSSAQVRETFLESVSFSVGFIIRFPFWPTGEAPLRGKSHLIMLPLLWSCLFMFTRTGSAWEKARGAGYSTVRWCMALALLVELTEDSVRTGRSTGESLTADPRAKNIELFDTFADLWKHCCWSLLTCV